MGGPVDDLDTRQVMDLVPFTDETCLGGHAIRDLVIEGQVTFADIAKLGLARFANLSSDWREMRGRALAPAPHRLHGR